MDSRLSPLDLADPPEQWDAIERRTPSQTVPPGPSTSHRVVIAVAALALAAASTLFAVRALSPAGEPVSPASATAPGTLTYTDPSGWTATYPASWTVTPIPITEDGLATGVMFSVGPPSATVRVDSLTITHSIHGLEGAAPPRWPHRLPLELADFRGEPGPQDAADLLFREGDTVYFARVTLLGASRRDVADMQALIASIRFPVPQS